MSSLPQTPFFPQNSASPQLSSDSQSVQVLGEPSSLGANEPITIQTSDTSYLEILSDELDKLDTHFEATNNTINLLTELYSLNPSEDESRFTEIINELANSGDGISDIPVLASNIFQLETKFEQLYMDKVKELQKLTKESYKQYSKSFQLIYEENVKNEQYKELEKTMVSIKPIELDDDQVLDLNYTKQELLNILNLEKKKRAKLAFENEQLYTPEIKALDRKYEKWGITDMELKSFLNKDMEDMNKKIQHVKKSENIQI